MKTTSLFVELLVIGTGAMIALALVLTSMIQLDTHWLSSTLEDYSLLVALFAFSFIYLLGIVVDRLADMLFDARSQQIKATVYKADENILADKINIYHNATPLVEMINYGRSRMRICRGWILNLLFIIIAFDGYCLLNQSGDILSLIGINVLALAFLYLLYICWKNLTIKEYSKIRTISDLLPKTEDNMR